MTRTLTLLAAFLLCTLSLETFAQDYRLIGYRCYFYYNNNWVDEDTMDLTYSNGRGGDYDGLFTGAAKPDTQNYTRWDANTGNIIQAYKRTKLYNQQNLLTEDHWQIFSGGGVLKHLYTYDVSNNNTLKLSQRLVNNIWEDEARKVQAFDINNNLTSDEYQIWNNTNSLWEPTDKSLYTYDLNNNMTSTLQLHYNMGVWDSSTLHSYHYTNNIQDTMWRKLWQSGTVRATSIYQNGSLATTYIHKLDGNDWDPTQREFFLYQGSMLIIDSIQNWDTTALIWKDQQVYTYTIDNNNDAISMLTRMVDPQTGIMRNYRWDTMTYNNGHKITWQKRFNWSPNTNTFIVSAFSREKFYYYEQYTNDVKNITSNASKFEIYPSPANDDINIHTNFETPEDFKVQVYDMQGRLVLQLGEKATKEYNRNIPLHNLPSGNYILQIAGSKTKAQEQFTILK